MAIGSFSQSCTTKQLILLWKCSNTSEVHSEQRCAEIHWLCAVWMWGSLLPLGCQHGQNGEKRISLRGRDRLRSDPQLFPGFLNCCSWMFPERLRNKSELVGSDETRQVLIRHPRRETPSHWILFRVSLSPSLRSLRKPGRSSLGLIQAQACSVIYRF